MKKTIFAIFILIMSFIFSNAVFAKEINKTLKYDGVNHTYSAEEVNITINGTKIQEYSMIPIILQSRTLVPARDVFENIGAKISWEPNSKTVTVEKGENKIILKINNLYATINGEKKQLDFPPKIINDYTMIPLRAVSEALNCETKWDSATRMIYINENVIEESGIYQGGQNQGTTEKATETTTSTPTVQNNSGGIAMMWDYIHATASNDVESKKVHINNLDVISPTWFVLSDSEGTVTSKASKTYSNWAHSNGYQVWALVTNSFDGVITHDVLSNGDKRQKVINSLCAYADEYDVDGINIDFESVNANDGEYYVQFIKEITPALKAKGLIVSVDMYVPTPWTAHYDMATVGTIVDYVVIMAYDEHWSTSEVAGSVGSIEWVDKYMALACEKVNSQKLIMGIPFYTRKWGVDSSGKVVSSTALGMEDAYNDLINHGVSLTWNEACGQNYGEYVEDGITYKIWLEDNASVTERMKVAKKYNVKGVSAWVRGKEKSEVWDTIGKYY